MKKIIFTVFIFLAALVQSTLIPYAAFFGVKPDLFWAMVMCAALYFDAGTAVIFSLLCGLLKDCLGTSAFGAYTLALPLWSAGISGLLKRISFDHRVVSGSVLGLMIFANAVILRLVPFIHDGPLPFMSFMRVSVLESMYTVIVFIWIGPIVKSLAESRRW
jgi:rod shape-determining protein MreD